MRSGRPSGWRARTGWSTGIHLHFTITVDGVDVDPVVFMLEHGAPLNGQPVGPNNTTSIAGVLEGGVGFDLPQPEVRQDSLHNEPLPIPAEIQLLYQDAAAKFGVPWTLLAGVGMEETAHGRNTATSTAGAQGLMQFMPATFAAYGVDGDGDGAADIHNPADSVYSAANYLVASGVLNGPDGVKQALYAYNHADWYVGDVLYYAHAYGGGQVLGSTINCPPGAGNPNLPPLADERIAQVLTWAGQQVGKPYLMGANGPDAYDCSSLVQNAYAQIGITMPRTAQTQRDWLAAGNGYQVPAGDERPGDLVFTSSYLGANQIGHVAIVWNPDGQQTVEAASTQPASSTAATPTAPDYRSTKSGGWATSPTHRPEPNSRLGSPPSTGRSVNTSGPDPALPTNRCFSAHPQTVVTLMDKFAYLKALRADDQLPAEVRLTNAEFRTLVMIFNYTDHDCRNARPSAERLANEIGITRTLVWRHIKALKQKGYLVVTNAGGPAGAGARKANTYALTLPFEVVNLSFTTDQSSGEPES